MHEYHEKMLIGPAVFLNEFGIEQERRRHLVFYRRCGNPAAVPDAQDPQQVIKRKLACREHIENPPTQIFYWQSHKL
jgi:hypothetical protein